MTRGGPFCSSARRKTKLDTLDAIGITHLHADHVSDLRRSCRKQLLQRRHAAVADHRPVRQQQLGMYREYMRVLFDADRGERRYLSGYLDGGGQSN